MDRRGGLKNDCQEAVVTYLLFLMFIDKRTGRMHDKPEPFLSALHRGSILACGIHYENKFTKTFRPSDILHIFTKF